MGEWLAGDGSLVVGAVMIAFALGLTIGMKMMDR